MVAMEYPHNKGMAFGNLKAWDFNSVAGNDHCGQQFWLFPTLFGFQAGWIYGLTNKFGGWYSTSIE
jgi:hypothetical protein